MKKTDSSFEIEGECVRAQQLRALKHCSIAALLVMAAIVLPPVVASPRLALHNVQYAWNHAHWHSDHNGHHVLFAEIGQ